MGGVLKESAALPRMHPDALPHGKHLEEHRRALPCKVNFRNQFDERQGEKSQSPRTHIGNREENGHVSLANASEPQ